jgi:prepilin-type N-terminal cleavage/methylation domain-containing protein
MKRRNGFTLIELVVVILILGILAGVAAPKMFATSDKAKDNSLRHSLTVIRDAIELHYSQLGTYPPCTGTGADFKTALKNYLRGPFPDSPVGTVDGDITPASGNSALVADDATGWKYNTTTGEFICNCTTASATVPSVSYDEF